jgi:protein gp37
MAQASSIEWTDATWNPIRGCSRVSEGCRNCYAEGIAARFSKPGQPYEGLARFVDGDARWTGKIMVVPDNLDEPMFWRKPRRIFVNSMSDLFHDQVTD